MNLARTEMSLGISLGAKTLPPFTRNHNNGSLNPNLLVGKLANPI